MVASHLEDNLETDSSCTVLRTNTRRDDGGDDDDDGGCRFPGTHESSSSSPTMCPGDARATTVPRSSPRHGNRRVKNFDRDWLGSLLRKHGAPPSSLDREEGGVRNDGGQVALRGKAIVAAPMVDQSDLPFRLLCRRYGVDVCYTPMIHADLFLNRRKYRDQFWDPTVGIPNADRPIVAQFAGSDPDSLLRAARYFERHVDAVDINCGCPQNIAKRGRYGAFLLEDHFDDLIRCVEVLSAELTVPVAVKVRLLPPTAEPADGGVGDHVDESIRLYHRLIDAGASMITVHGRTRHQKQNLTGPVDWDAIRRVVHAVGGRVPVIANGGVSSLEEAAECLRLTGADGVMSAEALLEYPPLFRRHRRPTVGADEAGSWTDEPSPPPSYPSRVEVAREYLDLCLAYPPHVGGQGSEVKCPKMHLHKFFHGHLQADPTLRDLAIACGDLDDMGRLIDAVEEAEQRGDRPIGGGTGMGCGGGDGGRGDEGLGPDRLSWYVRHRHQHQHQREEGKDRGAVGATVMEGMSAPGRGGMGDAEHDGIPGRGGADDAGIGRCEGSDDEASPYATTLFFGDDRSVGDY